MNKLHRLKFFFLKNFRRHHYKWGFVFFCFLAVIFLLSYFVLPTFLVARYEKSTKVSATLVSSSKQDVKEAVIKATHVALPSSVRAIYMTSCVAGTPSLRNNLVKLIEETEINSVVIDIKDYTGAISFVPENPLLKPLASPNCRVADMRQFIESLHKKGIYVIGRISVFQDLYLTKTRPELAVKRASDGDVWKDRKGLSFTDPGSREVWEHTVLIAKESYSIGFDELNFDYIRFPTDGNMKDIAFPWSGSRPKSEVIRDFFSYLHSQLKPTGAILSADLFGMTTTNLDDLNIGQVLEKALPYFDYIAPMVYPSHYPPQFLGFAKPAEKPYEVVKFSMDAAVRRTIASTTPVALLVGEEPISTTTKPLLYRKEVFNAKKIRPWLQDFNLGAVYTAPMVRAQIQAAYDAGLDSWMLWNASNRYTAAALKEGGEGL